MKPRTDAANTGNWLEASKGFKVRPYVESYVTTASVQEEDSLGSPPFEVLREISVLLPSGPSADVESLLNGEFQAWDALSDEALVTVEDQLD